MSEISGTPTPSTSNTFSWDRNATSILITAYETCPNLYRTNNPNYKLKNKRMDSLKELQTALFENGYNVELNEINKKIHGLRTQFFKEYAKVKKSLVSGAGTDTIFKSKLWCYEQLKFLINTDPVRSSESNLEDISFHSKLNTQTQCTDTEVPAESQASVEMAEQENEAEIVYDGDVAELIQGVPSPSLLITETRANTPVAKKRKSSNKAVLEDTASLIRNATSMLTNLSSSRQTVNDLTAFGRMQQQQLAAQLAHHGGDRRPPPLSPAPSDSDSDISLGAHSPVGSPGPLRLGPSSPNPITSFRFGPHSPGPMPAQFRFGSTHTSPSYRLDRQSPTPPNFRLDRTGSKLDSSESPPMTVDSGSSNYASDAAVNLRLSANESPIDVDSNNDFASSEVRDSHSGNSPVRLDRTPPQTTLDHSPPMNLSGLRAPPHPDGAGMKIETPLALRLTSANQMTSPLRVQINSHTNRMLAAPSPHTHLLNHHHAGIVRIAPQNPQSNGPVLHRPYSPPRLT